MRGGGLGYFELVGLALTTAITAYSIAEQTKTARKSLRLQKKMSNMQLGMDLAAHSMAMKQASLALESLQHEVDRADRIGAAQEKVVIGTLANQEVLVKAGKMPTVALPGIEPASQVEALTGFKPWMLLAGFGAVVFFLR